MKDFKTLKEVAQEVEKIFKGKKFEIRWHSQTTAIDDLLKDLNQEIEHLGIKCSVQVPNRNKAVLHIRPIKFGWASSVIYPIKRKKNRVPVPGYTYRYQDVMMFDCLKWKEMKKSGTGSIYEDSLVMTIEEYLISAKEVHERVQAKKNIRSQQELAVRDLLGGYMPCYRDSSITLLEKMIENDSSPQDVLKALKEYRGY